MATMMRSSTFSKAAAANMNRAKRATADGERNPSSIITGASFALKNIVCGSEPVMLYISRKVDLIWNWQAIA